MDTEQDKAEKIKKIEDLGGGYNEYARASLDEQLEFYESVAKRTPPKSYNFSAPTSGAEGKTERGRNENPNLNGIVNHGRKFVANFDLTEDKLKIALELKECRSYTSPFKIEKILESFFQDPDTTPGHWLYIAQNYTPRVIYWNINYMIKANSFGFKTFKSWASYFTKTIKKRKKRKN